MKQESMYGVYGISDNIKYFQGTFLACTTYIFRHTRDESIDVRYSKESKSIIATTDNYKIRVIG